MVRRVKVNVAFMVLLFNLLPRDKNLLNGGLLRHENVSIRREFRPRFPFCESALFALFWCNYFLTRSQSLANRIEFDHPESRQQGL